MNMLRILKILAIMSLALLFNKGDAVAQPPADNVKAAPISFANPAAVYCIDLGYSYGVQETEEGQVGFCTFPDGLSCNAWDFLAGKCGQAHSYCAQQGYQLETRWDGKDMFSQEYAVCLTKEGQEVGTVAALSDLNRKATEGCGAKAPEIITEESGVEDAPSEEILTALPTSFDWRSRPKGNYLTNVRDQGQCGSCWAFSAVGSTEAALNIAADTVGNNYDLSEQYLVSDCHSAYGYQTCCGGWHDTALDFIKSDGIPDEACMPYVDGNYSTGCSCDGGDCDTNCTYRTGDSCSDTTCSNRCSNWSTRLKKISTTGAVAAVRDTIKSTLVSKGPLSVSLRMGGTFDSNGVYRCNPDSPSNHAVVMVGYDDAGQYWVIRNSWGSSWNGSGYFKVGYGECNVEQNVTYATAASSSPIPVLVSPTGTITDQTPTYNWKKVSGATQYRYQVMKGTTTLYTKTVPASACGTTNCTNTPTTTLAYAAHKWRAQAYVGGVWKTYSAYKNFTVSAPSPIPVLVSPTGTITDRTPTYNWKKVSGATQYRYQVMKGTTTLYTKTVPASACGTTNCTNTPTTTLADAAHKWRAQAYVGGVWKTYSAYKNFTVNSGGGKPKAGFWDADYDDFYVTSTQTNVQNFATYVYACGGTWKITHTVLVPIVSNKFSFSGSFYANGTFTSTTNANGTDGLSSFYLPGCGTFNGGPWSWTAIWKSASEPATIVIQGRDITLEVLPRLQVLDDSSFYTIERIDP